jgi:hypothetical protein
MNDRLITLAGGSAALLIVIALLLPPGTMTTANDSRPTTTDRGIYGLQGLKTWLDQNHIPAISMRRRYSSLQLDTRLVDTGNLIIISIPQITTPSRIELDALADWIAQGNFILLLSAVNDRPEWSFQGDLDLASLPETLGLDFTSETEERSADEQKTPKEPLSINIYDASSVLLGEDRQALSVKPAFFHPAMQGVGSIATFRSLLYDAADTAVTGVSHDRQLLPLLLRENRPEVVLWEFRAGGGGGWISSHPDLFGNVTLGLADNARLFSNLLAAELGEDGYVIFDDMHFGISDLYDPDNFFSDPRLHNTLLFLGLFWLVYLIGYSNRLAPPNEKQQPPRASDFVKAMAGFFARRLTTSATGRGILDHFYADVRQLYRISEPHTSVRELLRNHSMVRETDIQALEQLEYKIGKKQKINLTQLTRIIDRLQRTLQ